MRRDVWKVRTLSCFLGVPRHLGPSEFGVRREVSFTEAEVGWRLVLMSKFEDIGYPTKKSA